MILRIRRRYVRPLASLLLTATGINLVAPLQSFALTSGPDQPEFSSFTPASTANMVDKFTGDFTYNLPLLDVPGPQGSSYPLSLSYHSGATPEEEASWVGYGWTLNPGAINRGTRGFPDDYNDSRVTYWNKVPVNWTATLGVGAGTELFSGDRDIGNASGKIALKYNSYQGFGYNVGLGVSFGKGLISLGLNETDGQHSYSATVNPMAVLSWAKTPDPKDKTYGEIFQAKLSKTKRNRLAIAALNTLTRSGSISLLGGNHGFLDFAESNRAIQVTPYSGAAFNVSVGVMGSPTWLPAGVTANAFGSFSYQENAAQTELRTYGYLYSAAATKKSVKDYYTEKASSYNKRDVFLGIPFNNADAFNVSGEGLGGSFRLVHDQIGEFSPNQQKSEIDIVNLSVEADIPVSLEGNVGLGFDTGVGKQSLEEGAWSDLQGFDAKTFSSTITTRVAGTDPYEEGAYFRFANDQSADSYTASINDQPVSVSLESHRSGYKPNYSRLQNLLRRANGDPKARETRGSYIGYHTIGQMGVRAARYCKRADIEALAYSAPANRIGEIAVVNETGRHYTYGLPLYASQEKNLQYGVQGTSASNVTDNNFIVYNRNTTTMVGEVRNEPYATTYLLTDVTTPDYVDRSLDGPTADDFGGYTRFSYVKKTDLANPYHWRLPYTGHLYQKNSLSDPLDDMGSVSEGDKETAYLQYVQTKTHTAIFTITARRDGLDADRSTNARTSRTARGTQTLYRLDKIELFANTDLNASASVPTPNGDAKAIKTVHFKYSYELCPNTPNSLEGGKLTLTKVWFEYQGVANNKITPYEFVYTYPKDYAIYPPTYRNRLKEGYDRFNAAGHELDQNPDYAAANLDAWGNYQFSGAERYDKMRTWPNQAENSTHFDPAAWQLKVIKLPSGGQIHVQYEQDDYASVQGKVTHVLASLDPGRTAARAGYFDIDPSSVGISANTDIQLMCDSLNRIYSGPNKKRLFFNFLYNLNGTSKPELNKCNVDYITGYVKLRQPAKLKVINGRTMIRVVLGDSLSIFGNGIPLRIKPYTLPYQVCEDFVRTQRRGKLQADGNCDVATRGMPSRNAGAKEIVQQLGGFLGSIIDPLDMCASLNPELSYFKIPFPFSKKGGGIRVKRLLTYASDPTMDGEQVLYGTEYEYKLAGKNLTSGVATNEPGAMRMENPLVEYIERPDQSWGSKIISGPDRKQSEGPIGESVMPAPSVGYSRIVERNIHSGKSNSGFSVTEYYTAKDFPVRCYMTSIERERRYRPGFGGLISSTVNKEWAVQGFSIVLNSMHGQLKRNATYAGSPDQMSSASLVTEQVQEYFQPNDAPASWNGPEQGSERPAILPGRDVDVTMAQQGVEDYSYDASLEFDYTVGMAVFLPIPFVSARLSVALNDAAIYTHATSKVVRYPAILKSVRSYQDGIYHLEENLALDQRTGKPVAVRSGEEFNGSFLKESVLASWVYPEKCSKALNEGVVLAGAPVTNFATFTGAGSAGPYYITPLATAPTNAPAACDILRYIHKGDLLTINIAGNLFIAGEPDVARARVPIYPTSYSSTSDASIRRIVVEASGNTNELAMELGSTVYHKEKGVINLRSGAGAAVNETFVSALNQQLAAAGSSTRSFTLNGPFDNMDISGFYDRLPPAFKPHAHSLRVKNMRFVTSQVNGTTKCVLQSFEAVLLNQPSGTLTATIE